MSPRYRIGFDIGGTFTDFILLDTARTQIRLHKCLTTPGDPSVGALEGLRTSSPTPVSGCRRSMKSSTAQRSSPMR